MTGQRFKKRGLGLVIYRWSLQISLIRADSPQEKEDLMNTVELTNAELVCIQNLVMEQINKAENKNQDSSKLRALYNNLISVKAGA